MIVELNTSTLVTRKIGAAPVVDHFLQRLRFRQILANALQVAEDEDGNAGMGRPPLMPVETTLQALLTGCLLSPRPLYAFDGWCSHQLPQFLGLTPAQAPLLQEDRLARALDDLFHIDHRATYTALVVQMLRSFQVDLSQIHSDTTSLTVSGRYDTQLPPEIEDRAPYITFGFNKDHRPDLKQLLYSLTCSADGAIPVHCDILDGNTSDSTVHRDIWDSVRQLVGSANFLYVADSKLCSRSNMNYIAGQHGRFLTLLPDTRGEHATFDRRLESAEAIPWVEVLRNVNHRDRDGEPIEYRGYEDPTRTAENHRVMWYWSSQKALQEKKTRERRLTKLREWLTRQAQQEHWSASVEAAEAVAERALQRQPQPQRGWVRRELVTEVFSEPARRGRGRPTPESVQEPVERTRFRIAYREDEAAIERAARCEGVFALLTNDTNLALDSALKAYKYQPYLEKRHSQMKSVFEVMPVWLKRPERVYSMLWLNAVVQLVQALVERELRHQMSARGIASLRLYPNGSKCEQPTTELVWGCLSELACHDVYDEHGRHVHRYYDPVSPVGRQVLELLGVRLSAYGITEESGTTNEG